MLKKVLNFGPWCKLFGIIYATNGIIPSYFDWGNANSGINYAEKVTLGPDVKVIRLSIIIYATIGIFP